jgi:hypothetical protein
MEGLLGWWSSMITKQEACRFPFRQILRCCAGTAHSRPQPRAGRHRVRGQLLESFGRAGLDGSVSLEGIECRRSICTIDLQLGSGGKAPSRPAGAPERRDVVDRGIFEVQFLQPRQPLEGGNVSDRG